MTIYVAPECHLCDAALEAVQQVRATIPFELSVVDITGVEELEVRYRIDIPVVEIEGARAFAYEVTADDLRAKLL